MADYRLIGTDQAPKDLEAKITGRARYAEDFRAEGMLFAKLLLSPVPHGRVVSLDTSRAEAMEGVFAIITADDFPEEEGGTSEPVLTNNPRYHGQPIAAVAAVDEVTAANAVAAIEMEIETLPFVVDPLDSLRPDGPDALEEGNAFEGFGVARIKWSAEEMAALEGDVFPEGEFEGAAPILEVGDLDAAFAASDLIVEQPILHQTQTHHPLEPRSAMAYWENDRCYLYCSVQSVAQTRRSHARGLGIDEADLVLISEFCGGGFGSKIRGTVTDLIPPALAREAGRPVMMRVTREEETYFGRARAGLQGWIKIGFRNDGKVLAVDQLLIQENGPFSRQSDFFMAGNVVSLTLQPEAMRYRALAVLTNTPPHAAQRGPGGAQIITMIQPVLDRAARELGVDRLDMMRLNAPPDQATFGSGSQLTSAYVIEAIDRGRELFDWDEKIQLSGQRNGSRVTGIGASLSPFVGGSSGYDGMLVIRPDGSVTIHSGVGNLGTGNVFDTAMAAAEVLGVPWEEVEVVWGNTENALPWSSTSSGSQTTHAHTRANFAAGQAARRKLQQIAAMDLGGSPEQYEVGNGRVYPAGNPSGGMTFAQAAERAIELGGEYDGTELPEALDEMTVEAIQSVRGQGLVAAATDEYSHEGATWSSVVAFAVVEVDVETGQLDVLEMMGVADVGTVVNPRSLNAQISGGMLQGSSQARFEKWGFDLRWGVNSNRRFYTAKPLSILDVPPTMDYAAVDLADPETPVGSRGVGEPPVGAGAGAITSAVMDALGDMIHRTPLTPDKILNAFEGGTPGYTTLQTHV